MLRAYGNDITLALSITDSVRHAFGCTRVWMMNKGKLAAADNTTGPHARLSPWTRRRVVMQGTLFF